MSCAVKFSNSLGLEYDLYFTYIHILFASNGYMLTDLELSRFDAIVVSSEVGYEKPAPEIFKIALGRDKIEFGL